MAEICIVCQSNQSEIKCDVEGDLEIYICQDCLDLAQDYFIFVCLECGSVYLRAKEDFIRILDKHKHDQKYQVLKEAYEACKGEQIIQGLSDCLECNPFKFYKKTYKA